MTFHDVWGVYILSEVVMSLILDQLGQIASIVSWEFIGPRRLHTFRLQVKLWVIESTDHCSIPLRYLHMVPTRQASPSVRLNNAEDQLMAIAIRMDGALRHRASTVDEVDDEYYIQCMNAEFVRNLFHTWLRVLIFARTS